METMKNILTLLVATLVATAGVLLACFVVMLPFLMFLAAAALIIKWVFF